MLLMIALAIGSGECDPAKDLVGEFIFMNKHRQY